MTASVRNGMKCKHCGQDLFCPHCGEKVTASTPFSDWLRSLPFPLDSRCVSNQNLDYIWHVYREDWFITIEEKRCGAESNFAQQDTHGIVSQILEHGSGTQVRTARGKLKAVHYRGHCVLAFEKTTPLDSEWITCNGKRIDVPQLLNLLRTGRLVSRGVAI